MWEQGSRRGAYKANRIPIMVSKALLCNMVIFMPYLILSVRYIHKIS